jgi:GNAT superfamily N-acetyltransferase
LRLPSRGRACPERSEGRGPGGGWQNRGGHTGPHLGRAPRCGACYNVRMLRIRPATRKDIPQILELIRALAAYEKAPQEAVATARDLERDGFSLSPKFRVLIAEWDRKPAGFGLYFYHYSTWKGRPTLFLEDLFVRPEFRGRGIGKALLVRLAKIALAEKCGRFEWQVLDWNAPAIQFYESLGAKMLKEWRVMRVTGEPLRKLARPT